MVNFFARVLKFEKQGEKTGWTYVEIPADIAQKLKPGNKKSFRVKGLLDGFPVSRVALLPVGAGSFILPLNAAIRKGTGKKHGAMLRLQLTEDKKTIPLSRDLMDCLADEPAANKFFNKLPASHRQYFSKWIESAKTEPTKVKRISQTVAAMSAGLGFAEMLRAAKANSVA